MNTPSLTNAVKKLTGLAGAASLTVLVGLPAIAQVNSNPSISNEAPANTTTEQLAPGSSSLSDACTTQSSAMSSSSMSMNGDMNSSAASTSGPLDRSSVGSSSYLGSNTTGTQNRAIYGINPSSNNASQSTLSNDSYQSNLGRSSYNRAASSYNTIHPTGGTTGGSVLQRYYSMMNDGNNASSSFQASTNLQNTNSSNPSIYRVSPSDVGSDSQMSSMESGSSNSASAVCRP